MKACPVYIAPKWNQLNYIEKFSERICSKHKLLVETIVFPFFFLFPLLVVITTYYIYSWCWCGAYASAYSTIARDRTLKMQVFLPVITYIFLHFAIPGDIIKGISMCNTAPMTLCINGQVYTLFLLQCSIWIVCLKNVYHLTFSSKIMFFFSHFKDFE